MDVGGKQPLMPPTKDRQNAHISVLEQEQAQERLLAAFSSLQLLDPQSLYVAAAKAEIKAAMAILGMSDG